MSKRDMEPDPLWQAEAEAAAGLAGPTSLAELVGFTVDTHRPLVLCPGHERALPAHTIADLEGRHVGRRVLLAWPAGEDTPVVMGVLRTAPAPLLPADPGHVELDADGQRLVVTAQRELVLRCGRASLLLRADGLVELRGESITSHASAANRVRGGSVQLN
ncbi:MAG: DUF6484 domain-containing protein [Rhizobacter sp.]